MTDDKSSIGTPLRGFIRATQAYSNALEIADAEGMSYWADSLKFWTNSLERTLIELTATKH